MDKNLYDLNFHIGKRDDFMIKYFQYLPVDCKQEIFKKRCGPYFRYLNLLKMYKICHNQAYFDEDDSLKFKETSFINYRNNLSLYYRFYKNIFIPKNMLPNLKYIQNGDRVLEKKIATMSKNLSISQDDIVEKTYIFLGFIDLYDVKDDLIKLSSYNKNINNKKLIMENNVKMLKLSKKFLNKNKNTELHKLDTNAMILAKPLKNFENIDDISDFKIIISDFVAMYYHIMQPSIALSNKFNFKAIFQNINN